MCGHPRSFLGVCQAPVLSEYFGALYVDGGLSGAIIVSEWSGAFCLVLERKDLEFLSRTELAACELDSLSRAVEGRVVCVISSCSRRGHGFQSRCVHSPLRDVDQSSCEPRERSRKDVFDVSRSELRCELSFRPLHSLEGARALCATRTCGRRMPTKLGRGPRDCSCILHFAKLPVILAVASLASL